MPIPLVAALPVAGRLGVWAAQRNGARMRSLAAQLTPDPARRADPARTRDDAWLTTEQHLALSGGLLGSAALGSLGLPVLHLVGLSGMVYLSGYFVYRGVWQWRHTRRVTLETNDAVLATGLLLTGQVGAGALFATLYFTGRKLEEAGDAALTRFADEDGLFDTTSVAMPKQWHGWMDQGALPLLALSVASTPLLGFGRAVGVLVANFAYDYRVLMPLGTIRFLHKAQALDIHIRNAQVLERLQQTDVLVLDTADDDGAAPPDIPSTFDLLVRYAEPGQATTVVAAERVAGRTVAYFHPHPREAVAAGADVTIACAPAGASLDGVHVVVPSGGVADLFALTASLEASRRRGLGLALAPSIVNLSGIFLWHFGPLTALTVDYVGLGAGLLNALRTPPMGSQGADAGRRAPDVL